MKRFFLFALLLQCFFLFPNDTSAYYLQQQIGDKKGTLYWQGIENTKAQEVSAILYNTNNTNVRGYEIKIYEVASTTSELIGLVAETTYIGNVEQNIYQNVSFSFDNPLTLIAGNKYQIQILTLMENDFDYHGNLLTKDDEFGNNDFKYLVEYDEWDDTIPQSIYGVYAIDYPYYANVFFTKGIYELEYHLSAIDENWAVEDIGCTASVELSICNFATSTYAIAVQATTSSLVAPWKYEYALYNVDGQAIEPQGAYSKATQYGEIGQDIRTDTIIFPDKQKNIYLLKVCTGQPYEFPLVFGEINTSAICKNMFIGNGYEYDDLYNTLLSLGKIATSTTRNSANIWNEAGCNDIGLDIFKGIKCAMIWAFAPSEESVQKFMLAKETLLTLYPIGYGTIILRDITTAFSTTSTSVFNRDIPVKELFGLDGGTTTINMDNMLSQSEFVNPFVDFVEIFLWFAFVGWLLMFSLTRQL